MYKFKLFHFRRGDAAQSVRDLENPEIREQWRSRLDRGLNQLPLPDPALAWQRIVLAAGQRRRQQTRRLISGLAAALLVLVLLPGIALSQGWLHSLFTAVQPSSTASVTGTGPAGTATGPAAVSDPSASGSEPASNGTNPIPSSGGSSLADMIAMVSIRGQRYVVYDTIPADKSASAAPALGDVLATVDFRYADEFTKAPANPDQLVVSTILAKGTEIRSLAGFKPAFRVGARDADGTIYLFQHEYDRETVSGKVGDLVGIGSRARAVISYNPQNDQELGRLVQADQVNRIAGLLDATTIRSAAAGNAGSSSRHYALVLDDGSLIRFVLGPDNQLVICGLTALAAQELTTALQPLPGSSGSAQAQVVFNSAGNGFLISGFQFQTNLAGSGQGGQWLADAYIDLAGNREFYLSGGLYLGNRVLAARGPVSDLQLWEDHYYLINGAGQVIRLGGSQLTSENYLKSWKLDRLTDISASVETAIVDPGPASRLRIWQGQLVILRPDGRLDLSGQTVRSGVTWFEIDSTGLYFLDGSGLGRLSLDDAKHPVQYWADQYTTAVAPAGAAVCYANRQGVFYQALRDEPAIRLIDFPLSQLICDSSGYCYGLDNRGLWQISPAGQATLLRAGKIRTYGLGFTDNLLLFLEEKADGSLILWRSATYPNAETISQEDWIRQYSRK